MTFSKNGNRAECASNAGFKVETSFSLEALAEKLSKEILNERDPFVPEILITPNYAQTAWLKQFIAKKNKICANIKSPSLDDFLREEIVAGTTNSKKDKHIFSSNALTLKIFKILQNRNSEAGKKFNFRENKDEDLIVLAKNLAKIFSDYQNSRPEMISFWQSSNPKYFDEKKIFAGTTISDDFREEYSRQKSLWKALKFKDGEVPALQFLKFLNDEIVPENSSFPRRIFIFATTTISKIQYDVLKKISEKTKVFFYFLEASKDLWTETKNARAQIKNSNEILGNELLTSWGKATKNLTNALIDDSKIDGEFDENVVPEEEKNLLQALQNRIRKNSTEKNFSEKKFDENDDSLLVHVAPSQLREVEILYDNLVKIFSKTAENFRAKNVLVMLPDVEKYAPLIHYVFDVRPFKFMISDTTKLENFPVIFAFFQILKIAEGDVKISEILELLENDAVAKKFDFDQEKDVPELQEILQKSNARWGISAKDREEKFREIFDKTPAGTTALSDAQKRFFSNNSWKFGMLRNALGIMLGDDPDAKKKLNFNAKNSEISINEIHKTETANLLGKFDKILSSIEKIHEEISDTKNKKTLEDWLKLFRKEIADKLLKFESSGEERKFRENLNSLEIAAKTANFSEKCSAKMAMNLLDSCSWEDEKNSGILRGKLTFCRLQPLRNIPADAIFVLGMDFRSFPRNPSKSSLNLVENWPQASFPSANWDFSERDKDLLLMLETLLSAKKILHFSYVSKEKEQPALPLDALISEAKKITGTAEKDAPNFVKIHRLHAFDESITFAKIAEKPSFKATSGTISARFLNGEKFPLNEEERKKFQEISLDDLQKFFTKPAEFFCKKRLNIFENYSKNEVSDEEPNEVLKLKKIVPEFFETLSGTAKNEGVSAENLISNAQIFTKEKFLTARAKGEISAFENPENAIDDFFPKNKDGSWKKDKFSWPILDIFKKAKSEKLDNLPAEKVSAEIEIASEKIVVFGLFKNVFSIPVSEEKIFVLFSWTKNKYVLQIFAIVAAALI